MKRYNVIYLLNASGNQVLVCRRRKEPYRGLLNLVGGKIKDGEDHLCAAYRELAEETGIAEQEVILTHLMDFTYYNPDCLLEAYAGQLRRDVPVRGDENELLWVSVEENFFNASQFAGDGNIGHMQIIAEYKRVNGAWPEIPPAPREGVPRSE